MNYRAKGYVKIKMTGLRMDLALIACSEMNDLVLICVNEFIARRLKKAVLTNHLRN